MPLALEGIQVLDLTRIGPGPYCTMVLADLGAEVLRVQPPPQITGDGKLNRFATEEDERSRAYYPFGRNKRSIALDLKQKVALEIFHRLATSADVVVESFRPGVVARLGVDYETLSRGNPRLVYCSITGYGQTGPYRDRPGHDLNYIAVAGALALTGERGGTPIAPLNLLGDYAGGAQNAVIGILAALMARQHTGRGQFVDIALTDGVFQLLSRNFGTYFETGAALSRGDRRLAANATQLGYNVYQCSDGKWISVAGGEPWFFANFCKSIGREDFLAYPEAGVEEQERMIAEARAVFRTKSRDEWLAIMSQYDQCVAPVLEMDEVPEHPQIQARGMVAEVDHLSLGTVRQPASALKLSDTPPSIRSLTPAVGEHTSAVLESLGYSSAEIDHLRSEGAVW